MIKWPPTGFLEISFRVSKVHAFGYIFSLVQFKVKNCVKYYDHIKNIL